MAQKSTETTGEQPVAQALIEAVEIGQLADLLQSAGYRVNTVEQGGTVQLMSASQGVGFAVRFGNVAAARSQDPSASATPVRYMDYTLSCLLQVQGELPVELVASWNRTKRFARLANHGAFLSLEMDVIVGGGVSARYLRGTIELWERLMQEFLLHLRNRPAMSAQTPVTQAVAESEGSAAAAHATDERADADAQ
ncbi:YbjN domain-containing protein [Paraburkholderia sp. ZP32-5]|uniref:YbjN domain-containing protein n=1 Tax=Paraburkholderia sp. ZP32-5 TaxID=2883245 RepID=UPI001F27549C|nr:YbjN domain-containing protein [Paraburkholderia sp. ZP32-5]